MNKRTILLLLLSAGFLVIVAACGGPSTTHQEDISTNVNHSTSEAEDPPAANNEINDEPEQDASDVNEPIIEDHADPEVEPETLYYMNSIYDVLPIDEEADQNVVLLTFDDGPKDKVLVEEMLDVLANHEAKAIFFVNGYRVEQNPDLLVEIYQAGHPIGNHSWDHIDLTKESPDEVKEQINKVQEMVAELTGEAPSFFRPPFGSGNDTVRHVVKENEMLYMTWSNGSLDWDANSQTPEAVIQNVLDQLRPGSNILMHELEWTIEGLDALLTQLTELGYSFVNPHQIDINPE